jgi:hypothetical protein
MAGAMAQYAPVAANRVQCPYLPQTPFLNQAFTVAAAAQKIRDFEAALRAREQAAAAAIRQQQIQQLSGLLGAYHGVLGTSGPNLGAIVQLAQQIQSAAQPLTTAQQQQSQAEYQQWLHMMGMMGSGTGLSGMASALSSLMPVPLTQLGAIARPSLAESKTGQGDQVTAVVIGKSTGRKYYLIRTKSSTSISTVASVLSSYTALPAQAFPVTTMGAAIGGFGGGSLPGALMGPGLSGIRVDGHALSLQPIDGYGFFSDKSGQILAFKNASDVTAYEQHS